jgi:hypothetical protein
MSYTNGLDNPELYFQVKLYTGNSSTQSITLGGDEDMQPDFVWMKARSDAGNHAVYDSVRGATKRITSEDTSAESTVADGLLAFDSDGFSLGAGGNENSATNVVAWCWKESATAGFDIVAFAGQNGAVTNVSHSLSAVPELIIAKDRDATSDWVVYHHTQGNGKHFDLNNQDAVATDANAWNDTTPTSSVFTVGENSYTNPDSRAMIYYLFAPKQGYSKFGSYTGNSSTDGTFVYTGFSPSFLMIKCTSGTEDWWTFDNKRNTYNVVDEALHASDDDAVEVADSLDFLSNGFKWRVDSGARNATGSTYVYMAFAEAPFVNSGGVPANAR